MNLWTLKICRIFHLISKVKYDEKRQIEIVKASPLFDAKWYLEQNPDVKAKKIGAAKHYVKWGWKEGRNPSKEFDTEAYLEQYPELLEKNWCPLFHYMLEHKDLILPIDWHEVWRKYFGRIYKLYDAYAVKYGKYRGKNQNYILIARSKYFNKRWYLEMYPDVKKAGVDPVEHYLNEGWKKGYNPSRKFNNNLYLNIYQDINRAKINPLLHYLQYGYKEKRIICPSLIDKYKEIKPNFYDKIVCRYKRKNPFISVIVASYNYQDYIKETLDSLVAQTYKNFEVIVIDDGSTDDSVKVIKKYVKKYPNIFLHRHKSGKNKGLPETVKLGLEKSKGDYIAFCESDDYWMPRHLEEKVKIINSYANPKIIINDVKTFGNRDRKETVDTIVEERKTKFILNKTRISLADFRIKNWIVTFSCCMVKKDALENCDITSVPRKANLDWWLWRQICYHNTIFYINKKLTAWRLHESYIIKETPQSVAKQEDFLKKGDALLIKKHLLPVFSLFHLEQLRKKDYYIEGYKLYKRNKEVEYQPAFSVIMPAYNRAFCITRAIQSMLEQSYQNFELIIVDDGSTDNTKVLLHKNYAKELQNGKIKYIFQENSGVCSARNTGLAAAYNEWIAYLDTDNIATSDFLENFAINILKHQQNKTFYAKRIDMLTKRFVGENFNFHKLKFDNYIDLGTFVHHRSVYEDLGGFDKHMTRLVDWELITRYTQKYYPYFINKAVLVYNDTKDYERITTKQNLEDNFNYFRKKHCSDYPVVTTMITAYNHEKYIATAIESAIKQTGSFIHEILISDDGSSDNTPQIIADYAAKYPNLIKDISHKNNVGISENMKHCFMAATGKYIAVLEGDDYWTSPQKLEKQMQFLEKNKDCSMVFSRIKLLNQQQQLILLERHNNLPAKLTGYHFLKELSLIVNFSCCMFRNVYLKHLPEILYQGRLSEISLAFYLEQKGKIGFINTPLSVYRQHVGGVWSGADKRKQLEQTISCILTAKEVADKKYQQALERHLAQARENMRKLRGYVLL